MSEIRSLTELIVAIAILIAGAGLGFALSGGLVLIKRFLARRPGVGMAESVLTHSTGAVRIFLPSLGLYLALPFALQGELLAGFELGLRILLVATSAYLLIRLVYGVEDFVEGRLGLDKADNLDARRVFTQLRVLRSVLAFFIGFMGLIFALLLLPGARQIGAGLLASAGIASLVIGFAAQRALSNLLAGFQIAFTQPIRLDDVVVVEGEWGRIEEITLTYVVVRIWDERRLILPISYFLEKPFANWTRESAEILGTVFIYVDYTVPVDAVRAELERLVAASAHWDGRVCSLVATDSTEHTLQLRALVSAQDGGAAWDLRCEVREGLVKYLQREHPHALPRIRAELSPLPR